jgi:hypothetical protein
VSPYLERIDPAAFADGLVVKRTAADRGLPILMQTGLGDTNVPHFAGMHHARTLGLALAKGGPMPVFGLREADLASVASAYQVFDRGWDPSSYRACKPSPKSSPIHEGLRRDASAVRQVVTFLTTGTLVSAP